MEVEISRLFTFLASFGWKNYFGDPGPLISNNLEMLNCLRRRFYTAK